MKINFGYSPCPNDTFMFWAWVHGYLETNISIQPYLADIQQLNRMALGEATLELSKASIATYLDPRVKERYQLLSVGAALGRGCGPLIVSKKAWSLDKPAPLRLAIPGHNTTACRLARMAIEPWVSEWVELRYDEIMPAVLAGELVDAGVIIHESRFAYHGLGLQCALDLGQWWEEITGLSLPLGVMLARKDLEPTLIAALEKSLRQSIAFARQVLNDDKDDEKSESLWHYLRCNATELDDQTIRSHIELYVNDFSLDLGQEGRAAIAAFAERAAPTEHPSRS